MKPLAECMALEELQLSTCLPSNYVSNDRRTEAAPGSLHLEGIFPRNLALEFGLARLLLVWHDAPLRPHDRLLASVNCIGGCSYIALLIRRVMVIYETPSLTAKY